MILLYKKREEHLRLSGTLIYIFLSFANLSSSFFLPLFSKSTDAVLSGASPSRDTIIPVPNLSCITVSPLLNSCVPAGPDAEPLRSDVSGKGRPVPGEAAAPLPPVVRNFFRREEGMPVRNGFSPSGNDFSPSGNDFPPSGNDFPPLRNGFPPVWG